MVHRPTWVGYVRSCVALPGVFCNFRQIPPRDSGPAITDQMFGWLFPGGDLGYLSCMW